MDVRPLIPADIGVEIPIGDRVLAVFTMREQPDGELVLQHHPCDDLPVGPAADLLRWMADRLEIAALEETTDA